MRLKKMGWIISLIFVMLIGCGKSTEQQITEQLSLGQKYLEEANYEEAIIAFNKIIELDPLVAEAYMGIAQCYENQSDYEEVLNILDEGVQVIGRDMLSEEAIEQIAEIYSRLSEWFTQQGNTDLVLRCYSAIIAFNKIIELDPLVAEAYMGIAQCYENQSDYEAALNILDEGVQVIGRDVLSEEKIEQIAEVYSRLSECFAQQGNTELVLRCYSAIMQLQPDNEEIREKEEEMRVIREKCPLLEEMAYAIVEEDVYDFQDMEILGEDFQALIAGLEEPVIFAVEEGRYLGVYPGGYIYYGEMKDGKRNGNGYWYYGNIRQFTKIQCAWGNDMPDGNAIIETYMNLAEVNTYDKKYSEYIKWSGKVEKGIYVGFWNAIFKYDDKYHEFDNIFFINGQIQKIGVAQDGRDISAYCVQCGSDDRLLCVSGIFGIAGCY